MDVTIGVGALDPLRNEGEGNTHGRPSVMSKLLEGAGETWIAGHMLNAELGGRGEDRNLTPLTSAANSQHKTWETAIKTSLQIIKQTFEGSGKQAHLDHVGIRYKVTANSKLHAVPLADRSSVAVPGGLFGEVQLVTTDPSKLSESALRQMFFNPETEEFSHSAIKGNAALESVFSMKKQKFTVSNFE